MLLMEDKGYTDCSQRIQKGVKHTKVHSLLTIKSFKKDLQMSKIKDKRKQMTMSIRIHMISL